jgi:palmitoyl transferase
MRAKAACFLLTAVLAALAVAQATAAPAADTTWRESAWHTLRDPGPSTWYEGIWKNWSDTFRDGRTTLMLPIHTYHMPYAYPPEKRDQYTEWPLGVGLGRTRIDEYGNTREVYAFGFQDSNGKAQYNVGYLWLKNWRPVEADRDFRLGAGYTVFLFARSDQNYVPIPGVLPVLSAGYKGFTLQTTFVPGGNGNGNVIFTWAQFAF